MRDAPNEFRLIFPLLGALLIDAVKRRSRSYLRQSHASRACGFAQSVLIRSETLFLFWPECDEPRLVSFEKGAADQIDAVGDCGKDGVQTLADRLGLAG